MQEFCGSDDIESNLMASKALMQCTSKDNITASLRQACSSELLVAQGFSVVKDELFEYEIVNNKFDKNRWVITRLTRRPREIRGCPQ